MTERDRQLLFELWEDGFHSIATLAEKFEITEDQVIAITRGQGDLTERRNGR